MMESTNLLGMLAILRACKVKPNFSELGRQYGVSRQTVTKYWNDFGKKEITRNRPSQFEQYREEVISLMGKTGVTKKSVYEYLSTKYDNLPNYSAFRAYTSVNNIKLSKATKSTVRFETGPGEQLQVDWKENIVMHSKSGIKFEFNILTTTLGYSRFHKFKYAKARTTEEFIRCVYDVFVELGGVTDHILTDHMPALVNISSGKSVKLDKVIKFERETGVKIKFCKSKCPHTKGKVESANRFLAWLTPYDGEFETEEELIGIIEMINNKVNMHKNGTTNKMPIDLFDREKDYLKKLSNVSIENYVDNSTLQIVPSTQLVYFKGCGYSVPANFVGKLVKVMCFTDSIFVYFENEFVTVHKLSTKRFNYKTLHYIEGLNLDPDDMDDDVAKRIENNLKKLSEM